MSTSGFKNIVTSGLVLSLDAGNTKSYPGSGNTWNDLSSNINNLSLTSTTFVSQWSGGINFNGSTGVATGNFTNPFSETVIVWTKSNTSTWNDFGWISSSRRQNGHLIHPNSTLTTVNFYVFDSSSNFTLIGTATPSNITIPHFYCYSTNGSNSHKSYLDGQLLSADTTSIVRTSSPSAQTWTLGKDDTLARYGNGVIFSVMRYNRQLTDAEVLQNYNATKTRFI